jgi:hypothetical protein
MFGKLMGDKWRRLFDGIMMIYDNGECRQAIFIGRLSFIALT